MGFQIAVDGEVRDGARVNPFPRSERDRKGLGQRTVMPAKGRKRHNLKVERPTAHRRTQRPPPSYLSDRPLRRVTHFV